MLRLGSASERTGGWANTRFMSPGSVSLPASATAVGPLVPQNPFNLADLLQHLASRLLDRAFVFQIWIVDSFSPLLFYLALHFVKLAIHLVLSTWFHVTLLL